MMKKYMDNFQLGSSSFFEPDLPTEKKEAFDKVFFKLKDPSAFRDDMGLYKKLWVQFNKTTWNDDVLPNAPNTEFSFVVPEPPINYTDSDIDGSEVFCSIWQRLDTKYPKEFFDGSRTFVCTLASAEADDAFNATHHLPSDTAEEIIANNLFTAILGVNYSTIGPCVRAPHRPQLYSDPDEDVPDIENGCEFWIDDGPELDASNPDHLWNGAWPNFQPGWTEEDYDCVRANLDEGQTTFPGGNCTDGEDPVLWFAGDAYCQRYIAFQHGAYQSGTQIANLIIEADIDEKNRGKSEVWKADYKTFEFCDDVEMGGMGNFRPSKAMP